jgi:tetratricopeptide (TPR) repeat protein
MATSRRSSVREAETLFDSGRFSEAQALVEAALRVDGLASNDATSLWQLLSKLKLKQGDRGGAIAALIDAATINPTDPEIFFDLGVQLFHIGKVDISVTAFRQAAELAPGNAEVWHNLGHAVSELGDAPEAETCFRKATDLAPGQMTYLRSLAIFVRSLGKSAEAQFFFEKALALAPDEADLHEALSSLRRYQPGDPQIAVMERLIVRPGLADKDRIALGYSLFKALDDVGDHQQAFRYLSEANRLQRKIFRYDPAPERHAFEAMKQFFTSDFFSAIDGAVRSDASPIFIVGMPRSGTTLTEQIMSAHSDVAAGGESLAMTSVVRRYFTDRTTGLISLSAGQFEGQALQKLGAAYLEGVGKVALERPRFTDKMPLNFQWVGFLAAIFPKAVFVHCVRDPVETCFSIYSSHFGTDGNRYGNDLGELADYYLAYRALMAHWNEVLPGRVFEADLDDMVADPENQTRRLLEFCRLDFEPACLAFHEKRNAVKTLSAEQVRKPVYGGHSERVRPYLPYLLPLTERLGPYRPLAGGKS